MVNESAPKYSLLRECLLSDGRLAWPVAQAAGISEATFRARLKAGLSPDVAATRPVPVRDADALGRKRAERQAREAAYQAARAAEREARRKLSTRPARLDALADIYAGVIWSDDAFRVVVSPRGANYAVQFRSAHGWQEERAFPSVQSLSTWVAINADELAGPGLSDALAGLPDDPACCELVPYRRAACR